jgi:predicted amidohydrolase
LPSGGCSVATVQCLISADAGLNGRRARETIGQAADRGARLVHFPEAALSGYPKAQIKRWQDVDWALLANKTGLVAEAARRHGVWVVIGCNRRPDPVARPFNSLLVISDRGELVTRYDKRLCSHTEITDWYAAGHAPTVFDVDSVRFGCALCIEVCFPELFAEYEGLGVDCMLLSSYSADPIHGVMARAHAATNCYWLSLAVPEPCSQGLTSAFFGPDGHVVASLVQGEAGLRVSGIELGDARYEIALKRARPWRVAARSGAIYGAGPR